MLSGASARSRTDLPMPRPMAGSSSRTPDLPTRLSRRGPLNVTDTKSFYGGDERGYIDFPDWATSGA